MFCDQCKLNSVCHRVWKTSGNQATNCVSFTKKKTNGDRMRAMADEELIEIVCHGCPPPKRNKAGAVCDYEAGCKSCWLIWLKEEEQDEKTAESFSSADR